VLAIALVRPADEANPLDLWTPYTRHVAADQIKIKGGSVIKPLRNHP
jgi:hypothetical protein